MSNLCQEVTATPHKVCAKCESFSVCFAEIEKEAKISWINSLSIDDGEKLLTGSALPSK